MKEKMKNGRTKKGSGRKKRKQGKIEGRTKKRKNGRKRKNA